MYKAKPRLAKFVVAKPTKTQPLPLFALAAPITLYSNIQYIFLKTKSKNVASNSNYQKNLSKKEFEYPPEMPCPMEEFGEQSNVVFA